MAPDFEPQRGEVKAASDQERWRRQRQFRDEAGSVWTAFERPVPTREWTSSDEESSRAGYGVGWLWFESGAQRRRLRLYPVDWPQLSDAALEALCLRALTSPDTAD